ncbi:hypothetical protein AAMO2058_000006200 [Amorphochlora amoebiformis]
MDNARTRTEITPDEGSRRPNPSVTKESQGSRDFIPDYPPSFVHLTSTALKKTKAPAYVKPPGASKATPLTFGVEFEMFLTDAEHLGKSEKERLNKLKEQAAKATELKCYVPDIKQDYSKWQFTADSSIRIFTLHCPDPTSAQKKAALPFELVSPILSGEDGLKEMETMLKCIGSYGPQVNRSVGFHVHVGFGSRVDKADTLFANDGCRILKAIAKGWVIFEEVFDAIMPPSRRGMQNQYARSNRDIFVRKGKNALAKIDGCKTIKELSDLLNPQVLDNERDRRYYKLNLQNMLWDTHHASKVTVEFRQHSGTFSRRKAYFWTKFLLSFVEAAVAGRLLGGSKGADTLYELSLTSDPETMMRQLFKVAVIDDEMAHWFLKRAADHGERGVGVTVGKDGGKVSIGLVAWGRYKKRLLTALGEKKLGDWRKGGPRLPLARSRIAVDGELDLVLDPRGAPYKTEWARYMVGDFFSAKRRLMEALETSSEKDIGYLRKDRKSGKWMWSPQLSPKDLKEMNNWAKACNVGAILLPTLKPNFETYTGVPYTPETEAMFLCMDPLPPTCITPTSPGSPPLAAGLSGPCLTLMTVDQADLLERFRTAVEKRIHEVTGKRLQITRMPSRFGKGGCVVPKEGTGEITRTLSEDEEAWVFALQTTADMLGHSGQYIGTRMGKQPRWTCCGSLNYKSKCVKEAVEGVKSHEGKRFGAMESSFPRDLEYWTCCGQKQYHAKCDSARCNNVQSHKNAKGAWDGFKKTQDGKLIFMNLQTLISFGNLRMKWDCCGQSGFAATCEEKKRKSIASHSGNYYEAAVLTLFGESVPNPRGIWSCCANPSYWSECKAKPNVPPARFQAFSKEISKLSAVVTLGKRKIVRFESTAARFPTL